jgi:gustatory receptor
MQLQLFSQQLLHSRDQMDFTACGLFPLDMSLLHSVVGAVTTYIIILLQFHAK